MNKKTTNSIVHFGSSITELQRIIILCRNDVAPQHASQINQSSNVD